MSSDRIVVLVAAGDDAELDRLRDAVTRATGPHVEAETFHNAGRMVGRLAELTREGVRVPAVIVDEDLRDGDGAEALLRLVDGPRPRPRTVLLTAGDAPGMVSKALQAKALDATLTKPWSASELGTMIDRLATDYFIEHDPGALEQAPQLVDVQLLSHAYTVAEGKERVARDELRAARRSFLGDRDLSDADVEDAMIEELDRVLDHPDREVFPEGTLMIRQGEAVDTIFVVLSGRVRLFWELDGEEIVFYSRTAGRILGVLAVARMQPATFNCRVVETVTAIPIPIDRLDEALQRSPTLTAHFVSVLLRSLARRALRSVEMQMQIDLLARDLAGERDQLAGALHQLEDAQTRLIESAKMATLGQLVAGVGHELNNPVSAISRAARFVIEDIESMSLGRPDATALLDAFHRALDAEPVSTRTERAERNALTSELGDPELARRLVSVGIRDRGAYETTFGGLKPDTRNALLDEIEAYHRLGTSLRNIDASANRVAGLVKSLRSYARTTKEPFAAVELADGLEESLLLFGHGLHDLTVEREYGDVPPVAGHPGELNQVWTNLISNALQAMGDGGTLRVRTDAPEPGWARVQVIDSGPGIAPDDMGRIFDLEFTTKAGRVEFGLGLGLRIAQDIVTRHGGRIDVESEPGRTCFSVWLPTDGAVGGASP